MLKIKLAPIGKKGQHYYRVSVMEGKSKLTGNTVEVLGLYDPRTNKHDIDMKKLKGWIEKGAQITDRVRKICPTL